MINIKWPKETISLVTSLKDIMLDLENTDKDSSKPYDSEWVNSIYSTIDCMYHESLTLQNNTEKRIKTIYSGMVDSYYKGSIEESIGYFVSLANITLQFDTSLLIKTYFPEKNMLIPKKLFKFIEPLHLPCNNFSKYNFFYKNKETFYSADVIRLSSQYINKYIYAPEAMLVEAYFGREPMKSDNYVPYKFFIKYLIPQVELIIAQAIFWEDITSCIKYEERMVIAKIRDNDSKEVCNDPRYKAFIARS